MYIVYTYYEPSQSVLLFEGEKNNYFDHNNGKYRPELRAYT